jgi:hypothetical protein
MRFNRRKMEDECSRLAEKEAAAPVQTDVPTGPIKDTDFEPRLKAAVQVYRGHRAGRFGLSEFAGRAASRASQPPQCLLLAQSGHPSRCDRCPALGGKADMP